MSAEAARAKVASMADTRPPLTDSGEKAVLLAFLDYLREAVIGKADGLSDEAGRTAGVPSGTSILGLIKHLAVSERYWFAEIFSGANVPAPDFSMDVAADETTEQIIADYRHAIERSNTIIESTGSWDTLSALAPRGRPNLSLRWVVVHMIEETGRHAGHADILRELIDGSIGR
jgi:hypothetical protein